MKLIPIRTHPIIPNINDLLILKLKRVIIEMKIKINPSQPPNINRV